MSNIWKQIRLKRLISTISEKSLMVPIDHGAWSWVMKWLENMESLVNDIVLGWADVIISHLGVGAKYGHLKSRYTSWIYHLSMSSMVNPVDRNYKFLVNSVENAVSLWADWISVHVNIGSEFEAQQLQDLGSVAVECYKYGMPLLAMMYPRGEGLTSEEKSYEMVSLAARIWAELGADIIKTYYTWNKETFKKVVDSCLVPIIVAWWASWTDEDALILARDAIDAWATWIAFWRKIFEHNERAKFLSVLRLLIHEWISVEEAMDKLMFRSKNVILKDDWHMKSLIC